MYIDEEYEKNFEKRTREYIKKIQDYQEDFRIKSVEELKQEKLNLKLKNLFQYLCAIFSEDSERRIKLCALEKVLKEKDLEDKK